MIERCYRTIVSILKTMGREMQEEWDLGVKAACLAYNTTVHTRIAKPNALQPLDVKHFFQYIGYIQFLKQTGRWNYPIIRLDRNN